MKKRNALFCLLSAATFVLTACGGSGESTVLPEQIVVKSANNTKTIKVGETLQFSATVLPEGSDQKVEWSVEAIDGEATITSAGLLTATKEGTVEVVAASYIDKEIKGKATLVIDAAEPEEVLPTSITVLANTSEIKVNETVQLAVRVTPENAPQTVTYSSSDENIATVSAAGVVKGKAKGEVTITAKSTVAPTVEGTIKIKVLEDEATDPTVDWSKLQISKTNEFRDAEKGAAVKVEGKCTIITKPSSKGLRGAYLQNGKAGYYIYGLDENAKIEVGKSYVAGGYKTLTYNGIHELERIELLEETTKTFEITETAFTPEMASDFDVAKDYLYGNVTLGVCTPVSLKVNTTKAYDIQSTYGGKEIYLRVDPNICAEGEFDKINKKLENFVIGGTLNVGKTLVTSFGYGGKLNANYMITSADDFEVTQLGDEELVKIAAESVAMPNFLKKGDNANDLLPKTVDNIDGISITYTYDGTLIGTDGIVIGSELPTFATVKGTIKKGEASFEKEYKVAIDGTKELTAVHTFDLEDALPAQDYGCSASKPAYAEGAVKLGNPAATWNLRNALIAGTEDDRKEGTFSIRAQVNSNADESARIELREDYEFSVLEFTFGTYGSNVLGTTISVSYSTDGGAKWTEDFVTFKSTTYTLETIKVALPETSPNMRVAIKLLPGLGKRVNIDNIKLLK